MPSFAGRFVDPNHPEGWRLIKVTGMSLTITGVDDEGGPEFALTGKLHPLAPTSATVDFGPKGGPADIVGVLQPNGSIRWPDGNEWALTWPVGKDYVMHHNLEAVLSKVVQSVVQDKSADPAQRMADGLAQLAARPPLAAIKGPSGWAASQPLGLRLGAIAQPKIVLEAYLDLVCPYSRKLHDMLTQTVLPHFAAAAPGSLQLVLHQVPQPWHFQSCILHEVIAAVKCVGVDAACEARCWKALFDEQPSFMDVAVAEKSKVALKAELIERVAAAGVDKEKVAVWLEPDTSNGQRNGGCAATKQLKYAIKHHRQVAMHVTPTCRINGVEVDTSSGWALEEWKALLEPLL